MLQRAAVRRFGAGGGSEARERFIQGFVVSSLVFCVGPLTILGSINEGLGNGADQLLLKSALDGFAAIAFAASFGWGVGASVIALVVIQGGLTALGAALGGFVPEAHLSALAATGGLLLVGVALRLLDLKQVKVADLLPPCWWRRCWCRSSLRCADGPRKPYPNCRSDVRYVVPAASRLSSVGVRSWRRERPCG